MLVGRRHATLLRKLKNVNFCWPTLADVQQREYLPTMVYVNTNNLKRRKKCVVQIGDTIKPNESELKKYKNLLIMLLYDTFSGLHFVENLIDIELMVP